MESFQVANEDAATDPGRAEGGTSYDDLVEQLEKTKSAFEASEVKTSFSSS